MKDELCRMNKMGVVKKTDEPTESVNPVVVVGKPTGSSEFVLSHKI